LRELFDRGQSKKGCGRRSVCDFGRPTATTCRRVSTRLGKRPARANKGVPFRGGELDRWCARVLQDVILGPFCPVATASISPWIENHSLAKSIQLSFDRSLVGSIIIGRRTGHDTVRVNRRNPQRFATSSRRSDILPLQQIDKCIMCDKSRLP